jgi:hypothetical protein
MYTLHHLTSPNKVRQRNRERCSKHQENKKCMQDLTRKPEIKPLMWPTRGGKRSKEKVKLSSYAMQAPRGRRSLAPNRSCSRH